MWLTSRLLANVFLSTSIVRITASMSSNIAGLCVPLRLAFCLTSFTRISNQKLVSVGITGLTFVVAVTARLILRCLIPEAIFRELFPVCSLHRQ
jgi:hypothetical protein